MECTTHGEIWEQRLALGEIGGLLNTIKVGTGVQEETKTVTSLATPAYGSNDPGDVNRIESADGTQRTYQVELQAGQQVAVDAEITEMGVYVGGTAADGTPIDFGDLAAYTDADGDLLHTYDTKPLSRISEGSRVTQNMTVSWRRV